MSDIPLPTPDDVGKMLAMMFDGLEVSDGSADAMSGEQVVAIYISDDDVPIAAAVSDYKFAAFTGAALTRIPPGGAEDAVESGELGVNIMENVHEIYNICSRLLMDAESPHLRLAGVYEKLADLPAEEAGLLEGFSRKAYVNVDVPNYGAGTVAFAAS